MKAYTDIEQSKKLAGILSLESADIFYADLFVDNKHKYIVHPLENYGFKTFEDTKQKESKHLSFIPCWSLTALLNALPRIDIEKEICSDDTYEFRVKAYIGDGYIGDWYDNPTDACYEMILKLHEQKFL